MTASPARPHARPARRGTAALPSSTPAAGSAPAPAPTAAPTEPATSEGLEPAPGSPEALALLAELGIEPRTLPGETLTPSDERFSAAAVEALTSRLVDVKTQLELLAAEQKELNETLRLAHLRGDLLHLQAGGEGSGYRLSNGYLLSRRCGRKQWHYTQACRELEAQLKSQQSYEQATGAASCSYGAGFWDLRAGKA